MAWSYYEQAKKCFDANLRMVDREANPMEWNLYSGLIAMLDVLSAQHQELQHSPTMSIGVFFTKSMAEVKAAAQSDATARLNVSDAKSRS